MDTNRCSSCGGRGGLHSTLCRLATTIQAPSTETIGTLSTHPTRMGPSDVQVAPDPGPVMPSPQMFLLAALMDHGVIWGEPDRDGEWSARFSDDFLVDLSERLVTGRLVPLVELDGVKKEWIITVREVEENG